MTTTRPRTARLPISTSSDHRPLSDEDELSLRLRQEALQALEEEPEMAPLLENTVLASGVVTFEDAVAATVTYRMLLRPCQTSQQQQQMLPLGSMFCPHSLRDIFKQAFQATNFTEGGQTMKEAVRRDAMTVCERDPAVDSVLEVVLFLKGFAALVAHRAAHYKWHEVARRHRRKRKSMVALWLQSQASAVFGVDIHPAAILGAGILLDHGTGIVIGETATVGNGCTLLHGVTLGGTGKDHGDRHPKVGADVLIGANASLLGNIVIGNGAKIGAGSIVLGHIPSGATAVGAPAKIIGRAKEAKPGSTVDEALSQVLHLHKSESSATVSTDNMTVSSSVTSHRDGQGNIVDGWDGEDLISEDAENAKDDNKGPDKARNEESTNITANSNDVKNEPPTMIHATGNSGNTNCCCPFRDYVLLARSAPPGSITLCTLRRLLHPEGCTSYEIGEVLFQLDTRNVGYCKPDLFFATGRNVIVQKTRLTMECVNVIMTALEQHWKAEQAVLQEGNAPPPIPEM
jgi:serine O-acetyltransferase